MTDRIVLVTGTSSGIGAAVCRRIAAPGVSIVMQARGGEDGAKMETFSSVVDSIRKKGAAVEMISCDFADRSAARDLVKNTVDIFGGLDQIVSNAGFADRTLIGDVSREMLDLSYQVITGTFFDMMTEAMPHLEQSDWGRVVSVSSFVSHRFDDDGLFPVTAAAKSGMEALAKTLAVQMGPHEVTVNCVVPGYTLKDAVAHRAITPKALEVAANKSALKRNGDPNDIAALVEFLLSKDARHITGQVIHVDGGLVI